MTKQPDPETERKRAWLNRYRESLKRENQIMAQIAEARSRATSISAPLNAARSAPTGSHSDRVADSVQQLDKLQHELDAEVCRGMKAAREIKKAVADVPDGRQRLALEIMFLSVKPRTPAQVAYFLNVTQRHTRRLLADAISALVVPEDAQENIKVC